MNICVTERSRIMRIEDVIKSHPSSVGAESFPLKHTFADGCYIREIFMPKGSLIVSKIHKHSHPYFVLSGNCSVLTENGIEKITAPFSGITKAGTKRVLYIHDDCRWVTVHVTNHIDLIDIEEEVIAKNFDEIDNIIDAKYSQEFISLIEEEQI